MTDELDTAGNPGASQAQQDDKAVATNDQVAASNDKAAVVDNKVVAKDGKVTPKDDAGDAKPADDWRVKFAGDDAKELKRLARFASEADMYKAYRELEKKRDSGEYKRPYPKDGTPEEINAWRKDNGIPEAPDKYDLSFDNGLVIGDQDKPLIDEFVTKMHGENATPAQVKAAISSYYEILGKQQAALAEADSEFKEQSLELLREEWSVDFKKNIRAVDSLLQSLPEDTRLAFETARTADGKLIGNDPAIIKWLAATAYELNPIASVMPSASSNPTASLNEEIASIEKLIGDKGSSYWKGPESEKMQARYLELLTAKDKIAARS